MITKSDVEKAHLRRKAAQELKDLDVDRVDGVDRPATGRHFLLFKAVGPQDIVGRTRTLPIEDLPGGPADAHQPGTGPRVADEGEDALGRAYDDSAFDRLAGANGKGSSKETGLPDAPRSPNFETAGGELVSPPSTYECEEVGEAGSRAVRVGPNFLASPRESGIAEPLDFRAPEPATVVKRRAGLFKSVVLGPMAGPARTSNFFDDQRDDSKVAKDGGSLFRNVIVGPGE